ncbi:MAG: hypothetical protein JSV25_07720 [Spirochaetota bacterium]|nr:MAG: hypothetical protein JSV25_07720 [Spirochaetota bacterium]
MPINFKKSENNSQDIDKVVHKLKDLYRKYAEGYGNKLFNLKGFEQRYKDALINKINLNAFLHAEILAFEELKARVERPKKQENGLQSETTYSDVADRIIEENLKKIRKYPIIDFHPDAEEETKYLLGTVTDFYYKSWNKMAKLLKYLGIGNINDTVSKLEHDFSYYVVPVGSQYSRAVDDYMLVLSRKNLKDNEKAAVNFIRYGGILFNNCLKLANDGLNFMSGRPEYEDLESELQIYKSNLSGIIDDFRLSDIRGY